MIDAHFPTLIYHDCLDPLIDNKRLYEFALEIEKKYPPTKNFGVYNSLDSINISENSLIKELILVSKTHIVKFLSEVKADEYSEILCKDVWINVSNEGEQQETHIHPKSHLSVVYYVSAPDNSGDLIFYSPTHNVNMFPIRYSKESEAGMQIISYKPKESLLMIFGSNLQHRVSRNLSKSKRVSIAMNFVLKFLY